MKRKIEEDAQLLAWAANKIRKEQDDQAYCTITFTLKEGLIVKCDRNYSDIPPSPGTLLKRTGG